MTTRRQESARVFAALSKCGLEVVQSNWGDSQPPPLPYLVVFRTDTQDLFADNSNYHHVTRWCAELYTDGPGDDELEAVEAALSAAGWPHESTEVEGGAIGSPITAAVYFTIL